MKTCMCYCFKPIYTLCVCMVLVKLACHTLIYCAFSLACRHVYSLYDNCLSQQLCCNLPRIHNGKLLPQRKATRCLHKRLWKHQGRKLNSLWLTLQHHLRGQKKKILIRHPLQCLFLHPQYLLCLHLHPNWRRIPFVDLILW